MIAGAQNYLDALLREMEDEEQAQGQSAWETTKEAARKPGIRTEARNKE